MRFFERLILFSSLFGSLAFSTPSTFSYQGRLFDDNGDPLLSGNAAIVLQIFDPTGTCLLFEESHNVLMDNSGGYFRVSVGLGTKNTSSAPNFSFKSVFSNQSPFSDPHLGCSPNYTPGADHHRLMRVKINGETLVPDQTITAAPFALQSSNSQKVEGKSYSDIKNYADKNLAGSSLPDLQATPLTPGDSFQWDGTKWITTQAAPKDLPSNSVTLDDVDFASSNGISIPSLNAAPGSPTAGQIYFNSVSNKVFFYDGTTWVDTAASAGGDFLANGSIAMTGNINLGGQYLSGDGGNEGIYVGSDGDVGIGTTTPQSALEVKGYLQVDVINSVPPSADCDEATEHGRMRVDADAGDSVLYVCTADGWQALTMSGAAGTVSLIQANGSSRWSNGSYSKSCYDYRQNSNYDNIGGGDSSYWINPNGDGTTIFRANCTGMSTGSSTDAVTDLVSANISMGPLEYLDTYSSHFVDGEQFKLNGDGFTNQVVSLCPSSSPAVFSDLCSGSNASTSAVVAITLGDRANLSSPNSTSRINLTKLVGAQSNYAGGVEYPQDENGTSDNIWYQWFFSTSGTITNNMLDEGIIGGGTPGDPFVYASGTTAASCLDFLNGGYYNSQGDGTYSIDPDGAGSLAAFEVTCDMTTSGGGWTVFEHTGSYSSTTNTTITFFDSAGLDRLNAIRAISTSIVGESDLTILYHSDITGGCGGSPKFSNGQTWARTMSFSDLSDNTVTQKNFYDSSDRERVTWDTSTNSLVGDVYINCGIVSRFGPGQVLLVELKLYTVHSSRALSRISGTYYRIKLK